MSERGISEAIAQRGEPDAAYLDDQHNRRDQEEGEECSSHRVKGCQRDVAPVRVGHPRRVDDAASRMLRVRGVGGGGGGNGGQGVGMGGSHAQR